MFFRWEQRWLVALARMPRGLNEKFRGLELSRGLPLYKQKHEPAMTVMTVTGRCHGHEGRSSKATRGRGQVAARGLMNSRGRTVPHYRADSSRNRPIPGQACKSWVAVQTQVPSSGFGCPQISEQTLTLASSPSRIGNFIILV